jgi:ribosomal protein S18 acetylase RimI-like enzyme
MYLVEISKIYDNLKINDDIRNRIKTLPPGEFTKHLLLVENSKAYAFLSIDLLPDSEYLVLYEIYVSSFFRKKGIGTVALKMVEKFYQNSEYKKIILNPSPLDENIEKRNLINWYKKNGYKKSEINDFAYEKSFSLT